MRCVLMTPLGAPVEPEVKRSLAMVSGPTFACAASTSGPAGFASIASSSEEGRVKGGLTRAMTSTSLGTAASIAATNGLPSPTKTRPGVRIAMMAFSLAKSFATSE